jgi:hypothetical protein
MTKTSSASSNDKETATKAKPTSAKGSSTRKSSTEIILSVLATLYQRGNKSPEKKKVESLCKLNSNKTFLNSITQLKKTGMIVADGEAFCLTDKAIASLGDEMISGGGTNEEVHGRILANLKAKRIPKLDWRNEEEGGAGRVSISRHRPVKQGSLLSLGHVRIENFVHWERYTRRFRNYT